MSLSVAELLCRCYAGSLDAIDMTPGEDYVNEVLRWLNRVTCLRLGDTAAPDVFRVKEGPVMVLTSAFAATVVCRCHLGTGEYPWIGWVDRDDHDYLTRATTETSRSTTSISPDSEGPSGPPCTLEAGPFGLLWPRRYGHVEVRA